jgi:hypothetical protein
VIGAGVVCASAVWVVLAVKMVGDDEEAEALAEERQRRRIRAKEAAGERWRGARPGARIARVRRR